jgi:hypothetical protein
VRPLQAVLNAQPRVVIGLIAHLTGATLQEDIAHAARRLQNRGTTFSTAQPQTTEATMIEKHPICSHRVRKIHAVQLAGSPVWSVTVTVSVAATRPHPSISIFGHRGRWPGPQPLFRPLYHEAAFHGRDHLGARARENLIRIELIAYEKPSTRCSSWIPNLGRNCATGSPVSWMIE